jgi:hypothetical protein
MTIVIVIAVSQLVHLTELDNALYVLARKALVSMWGTFESNTAVASHCAVMARVCVRLRS